MLSQRLIRLRKSKRKTQEDIAKVIGVTRPAYTAYERGSRTPDYDILKVLANYYDVTIDYLLGHHRESQNETDERVRIINKIKTEFPDIDLMFRDMENMTAEQLEEVYEFIKFKKSQKGD